MWRFNFFLFAEAKSDESAQRNWNLNLQSPEPNLAWNQQAFNFLLAAGGMQTKLGSQTGFGMEKLRKKFENRLEKVKRSQNKGKVWKNLKIEIFTSEPCKCSDWSRVCLTSTVDFKVSQYGS
jgi:hypothetical protein